MFKYIVKRLALSLVVLFGVSVIIYFLVRLMPSSYVDEKFAAQIQQGTMTEEDIDRYKKQFGLYMPEAYVTIELSGYEAFTKDAKEKAYENMKLYNEKDSKEPPPYTDFYAGTYEIKKEDVVLKLIDDGRYNIIDTSNENEKIIESGTFRASADSIEFMRSGTEEVVAPQYKKAGVWKKFVAILGGYFEWLGNMLRGDLGDSFSNEGTPVGKVIASHVGISFTISLIALILQFAIAIPLGIISATRQYSAVDYTVTIITMIGISLPSFFFAALLVKVFASWLGWFPVSGLVSGEATEGIAYFMDMLHHLALPMVVLVVLSIGGLMRYTRTNMLEVLNSDYIRTARSKGLSEKKVIYVHAFRNTMIPLMTMLAGILPSLFGGAMITEEVFAIDGIGRLAYKALRQGDIPFIMGYNMFLAVLTVIGTLLSDLMYALVDPRVKLSK